MKVDVFRACRRYCLDCQGGSTSGVRRCADAACALWDWRLPPEHRSEPDDGPQANARPAPDKRPPFAPSPERQALRRRLLRAMRRQCLACAGHRRDVRQCSATDCHLWPLRFGVMPETCRAVNARFFAPKRLSLF